MAYLHLLIFSETEVSNFCTHILIKPCNNVTGNKKRTDITHPKIADLFPGGNFLPYAPALQLIFQKRQVAQLLFLLKRTNIPFSGISQGNLILRDYFELKPL